MTLACGDVREERHGEVVVLRCACGRAVGTMLASDFRPETRAHAQRTLESLHASEAA